MTGRLTFDVSPKSSLAEYSWSELSGIAAEVSAAQSETEAMRIAAKYKLCASDGSIADGSVKSIEMADGCTVQAILAGIAHDERSDGGKAGLTFVFADAATQHAMNHAFEDADSETPDSTGGWGASDMRAWLNSDFFAALPADLRNCIVAVQKRTANRISSAAEADEAGHMVGTRVDWIDETSDKIWLLSAAELCGSIPAQEDVGIDETMVTVYEGEGSQYRLFADEGVAALSPNPSLVRSLAGQQNGEPCTWWLRTKTLEFDDGFWLVGTDGAPLNGFGEDARVVQDPEYAPDTLWGPDHARGVVVGFCL